jgi:hypothetical protein
LDIRNCFWESFSEILPEITSVQNQICQNIVRCKMNTESQIYTKNFCFWMGLKCYFAKTRVIFYLKSLFNQIGPKIKKWEQKIITIYKFEQPCRYKDIRSYKFERN